MACRHANGIEIVGTSVPIRVDKVDESWLTERAAAVEEDEEDEEEGLKEGVWSGRDDVPSGDRVIVWSSVGTSGGEPGVVVVRGSAQVFKYCLDSGVISVCLYLQVW